MAPEIVQKLDYLGQPVDVWALGVVLYKMLTGSYTFGGIFTPPFSLQSYKF